MASKWRSQQRRQRWEQASVVLPQSLSQTLQQDTELGALGQQLLVWARLSSTFAQVAGAKQVAQTLLGLLKNSSADSVEVSQGIYGKALDVYVEVLFQENSKPVHRTLLTALSQLPLVFEGAVISAFKKCCRDYGSKGAKQRRFALVAAAVSLANLPKPGLLKGVLERCTRIIGFTLSCDLQYVLQQAHKGENATPAVMEECQDAMATLYHLLQHFPEMFETTSFSASIFSADTANDGTLAVTEKEVQGVQDAQNRVSCSLEGVSKTGVFGALVNTVLDVLQTSLMSRDCVVAAGVCLCTAALLQTTHSDLSLILANSIFGSPGLQFSALTEGGIAQEPSAAGMLELTIAAERHSSLASEIHKLTDFGKLCVMRGLLTGLPRAVLNIALLTGVVELRSLEKCQIDSSAIADNSVEMPKWSSCQVWTLLYDGILPTITSYCESSVDSHFKFHSITALQICLQQIKASMLGYLTDAAVKGIQLFADHYGVCLQSYEIFLEATTRRVLKLIWNNWEDPLAQTVKQVQAVFDLLADVQSLNLQGKTSLNSNIPSEVSSKRITEENTGSFLRQIAADLLSVGGHRKGRYVPLASLAMRLGAKTLLDMKPELLSQTVYALSDDDVCCSASSFLKSFLERLREECWSSEGVMEGYAKFRGLWIPAILAGLLSGNPRLRSNTTTYALPVALQIDGDSLLPMLAFLLDGFTSVTIIDWQEIEGSAGMPKEITMNQRVAGLVSLLKVARSLFLVEGEIVADIRQRQLDLKNCEDDCDSTMEAMVFIKGQVIHVPICLLELALTHIEDGLRIDAAELLGLNPKTASMPSYLELYLLKHAIPLNMRCSSTAFRMKWTTLLKKFFSRVRTAVERQIKTRGFNIRTSHTICTSAGYDGFQVGFSGPRVSADCKSDVQNRALVTDTLKTVEENRLIELAVPATEAHRRVAVTVEDMEYFMKWLSQLVIYSLYPSAPYERKNMAMELFSALLEVWSLSEFSSGLLHGGAFTPYHIELLSAESTLVLVGAVVDSWDRLRENAYKILVHYPTPLPGMDTEYAVQGLLRWAKGLASSPRVRESDAGALVLRLVFRKYVCEHAWMVQVHANPEDVIVRSPRLGLEKEKLRAGEVGLAMCLYIDSLNNWLEAGIQEGEKDLLAACKHSLVHGVLLTLRYTMDEIDWTSDAVHAGASRLQSALRRLLGLVLRVTSLTLGVVSADALNILEHTPRDSNVEDVHRIFDDTGMSIYEDGGELKDLDDFSDNKLEMLAPAEQMMMVGCWLSMKEVSLLLGTITRRAPLSGCAVAVESQHGLISTSDAPDIIGTKGKHQVLALLDAEQLEMIGEHFLRVLFSMKHNGAVDKTRAGFSALCNRLLHADDTRLGKMPEIWLQQLMERTCSKGQTVDDLLRRSAGLPAAFLALFLAEPDGAPRRLLPMAMKWLMCLAKCFLMESIAISDSESQSSKTMNGEMFNSSAERKASRTDGSEDVNYLPKAIKAREEGVVPTVHAFNVLKVAFHDTNLATDTSGFCAEGLIISIQAFSSRHWEVRNSATLAFTALVHRTVGYLNVHKRETARRTISGFEFFNRFPSLHPFLLQELKFATVHLEHASSGNATTVNTMSNALHPSLAPILIILSRLKPSAINTGVEDWLSPSLFMPLVMRCATQRNLKVRVLASQALPPLVSSGNLSKVLIELVNSLPAANKIGITTNIPSSLDSESCTNHPSAGNERPSAFRYNAIHGALLQICALLEHNTATLSDFREQENIVFDVFEHFQSCLWLGSTRLCSCYVVISEFLHVLQVLLQVAEVIEKAGMSSKELTKRICSVLLDLCAQCLGNRVVLAGRLWDANVVRLLERAADLYFSTVFKALLLEDVTKLGKETSRKLFEGKPLSDTPGVNCQAIAAVTEFKIFCINPSDEILHDHLRGLITRLRDALADDVYEVRLVTLKALKHCDRISIIQLINEGPLHPYSCRFGLNFKQLHLLLIDRLMAESHPKCLNCLLHLLFTWQLLSVNCQGTFSGVRNIYLEDIYPQQGTESCERLTACAQIYEVSKYFSTMQLWNRLIEIYTIAKVAKMKEMTIRCLGGCLSWLIADIRQFLSLSLHSCNSTCVEENIQPCNGQSDNLSSQASGVIHEVGRCAGLPIADSVNEPDIFQNPPFCFRHCFEDRKVENWKSLSKAVDDWTLLIAKHSTASEPMTFRRAVAEAVAASGILKDVSWVSKYIPGYFRMGLSNLSEIERDHCLKCEWYGRSVLSMWSICIKLLEDENLTLRQMLATSILSIVGSRGKNDGSDTVLAQVEMVIVLSFNHLTECLAHWNLYFDYLALWTFGSESSSPKSGDVDLVRRLFDKEIDNHHEEELLIVQLCCLQLQKILILEGRQTYTSSNPSISRIENYQQNHTSPDILSRMEGYLNSELEIGEDDQDELSIENAKANFFNLVHSWRLKFLDEVIVCARWCNMAQSSAQWLGGITNHQDVFGVLYRNLLGLYSLIGPSSNVSDNFSNVLQEHSIRDFMSRIIELAGLLRSIPLNPIIHNLLDACLLGYECHFGVDLGSALCKGIIIDSTTSKFEPFFLIK